MDDVHDVRRAALRVLLTADPAGKATAARALAAAAATGDLDVDADAALDVPLDPGRPPRPRLVPYQALPRRSAYTPQGRAALLHAVAHIELNAIDLAVDAVARFPNLPRDYYLDWLRVAGEEALHYTLLSDHLAATLSCRYGDFDAHDGLWAVARRTAGDVVARMALVPRTLEARGLDATPPMQARLAAAGDARAAEILGVILRDEVGHVAIGNRWYRWLCARDGIADPAAHAAALAAQLGAPRPSPPFNVEARRAAGFSVEEIDALGGA